MPSKFWGSGRSVVRAFKGVEDWGRWMADQREKAAEQKLAEEELRLRREREERIRGAEEADVLAKARERQTVADFLESLPGVRRAQTLGEGVQGPMTREDETAIRRAQMLGGVGDLDKAIAAILAQPELPEPEKLTDWQKRARALGMTDAEYLRKTEVGIRPEKIEKPTIEPPSATARFIALPPAQRAFAEERFKAGEEFFGRALAPSESTAIVSSAEKEFAEEAPSKADVDVGQREIQAAAKAVGLIKFGDRIRLTDRGVETAAWLGSTVGGYKAQNKRTTAQNRLRNAEEIAKLFELTDEKADDEE